MLLNNIYFGKTAEGIVFDYIQAQGGELVRLILNIFDPVIPVLYVMGVRIEEGKLV